MFTFVIGPTGPPQSIAGVNPVGYPPFCVSAVVRPPPARTHPHTPTHTPPRRSRRPADVAAGGGRAAGRRPNAPQRTPPTRGPGAGEKDTAVVALSAGRSVAWPPPCPRSFPRLAWSPLGGPVAVPFGCLGCGSAVGGVLVCCLCRRFGCAAAGRAPSGFRGPSAASAPPLCRLCAASCPFCTFFCHVEKYS